MKVLVVSHPCIIDRNRSKFIEINNYPGVEMAIILPKYFRDDISPLKRVKQSHNSKIKIYPLHPLLANIPNKSINLHFYSPMCEKVVSEFEPDIIHLEEEPYSLSALQFAMKMNKRKVKLLFFTEQNLLKRYPLPFCKFEQYVYKKSSCAMAVSETARNVLLKKGYQKKVFIIPHEVDTQTFHKMDSKLLRKNLNLNGFVIGYAGRLMKEKGIGTLLKAVSSIKANNISLFVVGRGPLLNEVNAIANKVNLIVIENVPHNEIYKYLNCMDVLVLPSITMQNWKEQFGRVIIEAMACKVPIIGSSSGEIPNIIGGAGLIFNERDADDLIDKLKLLVGNKTLCYELAEQGYEKVAQNFSLEKVAGQIYEVYKWVINNG
ncbi:MAG: glycosyltransferase [Candidatus Stahlbacteria bacterium]|nr:glycosyltransferase [Candidatus Stahlbacteria bacterium]